MVFVGVPNNKVKKNEAKLSCYTPLTTQHQSFFWNLSTLFSKYNNRPSTNKQINDNNTNI